MTNEPCISKNYTDPPSLLEISGNFILHHDWKTPRIKKCLSVPPVVYPSIKVFMIVRLPSTSIYGLFRLFPEGIFNRISVLTPSIPLPFAPQKMTVFFKTVCASIKVILVVRLPSTSIYGLSKRFPMGVYHRISVLTPPSLFPPPPKK